MTNSIRTNSSHSRDRGGSRGGTFCGPLGPFLSDFSSSWLALLWVSPPWWGSFSFIFVTTQEQVEVLPPSLTPSVPASLLPSLPPSLPLSFLFHSWLNQRVYWGVTTRSWVGFLFFSLQKALIAPLFVFITTFTVWDYNITTLFFPFSPSKPLRKLLFALFQIHGLFFINCCYMHMHIYS